MNPPNVRLQPRRCMIARVAVGCKSLLGGTDPFMSFFLTEVRDVFASRGKPYGATCSYDATRRGYGFDY